MTTDPSSGTWIPWTLLAGGAAFIWKAAADYTTMKNLQKNMVTKLDLANIQMELKEFLREHFVSRIELNSFLKKK